MCAVYVGIYRVRGGMYVCTHMHGLMLHILHSSHAKYFDKKNIIQSFRQQIFCYFFAISFHI